MDTKKFEDEFLSKNQGRDQSWNETRVKNIEPYQFDEYITSRNRENLQKIRIIQGITEFCASYQELRTETVEYQVRIVNQWIIQYFHKKDQVLIDQFCPAAQEILNLIISDVTNMEIEVIPTYLNFLRKLIKINSIDYLLTLEDQSLFTDRMESLLKSSNLLIMTQVIRLIKICSLKSTESAILVKEKLFWLIDSFIVAENMKIGTREEIEVTFFASLIDCIITMLKNFMNINDHSLINSFDIQRYSSILSQYLYLNNEFFQNDGFECELKGCKASVEFVRVVMGTTSLEIFRIINENQLLQTLFNVSRNLCLMYAIPPIIKQCFKLGPDYVSLIHELIPNDLFYCMLRSSIGIQKLQAAECIFEMLNHQKEYEENFQFSPISILMNSDKDIVSQIIPGLSEQPTDILQSYLRMLHSYLMNLPTSYKCRFDVMVFVKNMLIIIEKGDPELTFLSIESMNSALNGIILSQDEDLINLLIGQLIASNADELISQELNDPFSDTNDERTIASAKMLIETIKKIIKG